MLQSLIGTDGAIEHHSVISIGDSFVHSKAADTGANSATENAFRIEGIEKNIKALADFAEDILRPQFHIIKKHLILQFWQGNAHGDGLHFDTLGLGGHNKQGKAVCFALGFTQGGSARHHQGIVRFGGIGNVGFIAAQLKAALPGRFGKGTNINRIRTGTGLRYSKTKTDIALTGRR